MRAHAMPDFRADEPGFQSAILTEKSWKTNR